MAEVCSISNGETYQFASLMITVTRHDKDADCTVERGVASVSHPDSSASPPLSPLSAAPFRCAFRAEAAHPPVSNAVRVKLRRQAYRSCLESSKGPPPRHTWSEGREPPTPARQHSREAHLACLAAGLGCVWACLTPDYQQGIPARTGAVPAAAVNVREHVWARLPRRRSSRAQAAL